MRRTDGWRWRHRKDRTRVTPRWMAPLPDGPVTFDPSLRTAAELLAPSPRVSSAPLPQRDAA